MSLAWNASCAARLTGPTILHALMLDDLARLRELAVAAGFGGDVDDDGAGLHALDRGARDDARRAASRHRRGGDDGIGDGDARVEHFLLLALLVLRELARIAAGALGRDAGVDELGAERLHLLARGAAHVVGLDHGAEALGGGDGLQSGHAHADDQHLRRADGARGGGQHRQEAIERVGRDQHRLVAGDGGLRGQRIHRLRARDARHQFHREAGDLPIAQRLDFLGAARAPA